VPSVSDSPINESALRVGASGGETKIDMPEQVNHLWLLLMVMANC
jgi:hypothetical protein